MESIKAEERAREPDSGDWKKERKKEREREMAVVTLHKRRKTCKKIMYLNNVLLICHVRFLVIL